MVERYPLTDFDGCECGDYRRDHDGLHGAGRCRMANDLTHGFEPCPSFRLYETCTELPEYWRKRKEALERLDKSFEAARRHVGRAGAQPQSGASPVEEPEG